MCSPSLGSDDGVSTDLMGEVVSGVTASLPSRVIVSAESLGATAGIAAIASIGFVASTLSTGAIATVIGGVSVDASAPSTFAVEGAVLPGAVAASVAWAACVVDGVGSTGGSPVGAVPSAPDATRIRNAACSTSASSARCS